MFKGLTLISVFERFQVYFLSPPISRAEVSLTYSLKCPINSLLLIHIYLVWYWDA